MKFSRFLENLKIIYKKILKVMLTDKIIIPHNFADNILGSILPKLITLCFVCYYKQAS